MYLHLLDADSGLSDWGLKMNTCEGELRGGVDMSVSEHARIEWGQFGSDQEEMMHSDQERQDKLHRERDI